MHRTSQSTTLTTTETSLAILEKIRELDGVQFSTLVEECDFAKSTIYKHLNTLEQHGYVLKEDGEFQIGYKFISLGEYARLRKPEFKIVERELMKLAKEFNEESVFVVEDQGRLITIHSINLQQKESNNRRRGSYHYMHNNATGKAILAELSDSRVKEIVDQWGLPRATENTITNEDDLFAELEAIREQGYARNDEEFLKGMRAVGAAVTHSDERVVGAISVSGPTYRLTGEVFREDIPRGLLEYGRRIQKSISNVE